MRLISRELAVCAIATIWCAPGGTIVSQSALPAVPTVAFDPFPGGIAGRYHFDFSRTLYASDSVARADRDALRRAAASLDRRGSDRERSARALLSALQSADSLDRALARQYAYLSLRPRIDTRDTSANTQLTELLQSAGGSSGQVMAAVMALDDTTWARLIRQSPGLARYGFAREQARRQRSPRALPRSAETDSLRQLATGWGPAQFNATLASITFGTVAAPEGPLDVRSQSGAIYNHPVRTVREAGMRANWRGFGAKRDTFALILTRTAEARTRLARLQGFSSHTEESYRASYLTPTAVRTMLETLERGAEENKRYERLRIARLRRVLRVDTVQPWDLTATPAGLDPPRLTAPGAATEVVAAVAPFGRVYVDEMRALLDPANGRLDIAPGPYRMNYPGFSTGLVGYPSLFYQGRFEGFTSDVVILAHEAGHAVQNMLMSRNGVLPRYAGGPNYFTESYAALNELLVLERLARSAGTPRERMYFLERLLDQATDLYRNGYEALIEERLYDSVAAGHSLDAVAIESLTQRTAAGFSVWYGGANGIPFAWIRPLQYFTRPLYRVNYVYAKLLALGYYARLRASPSSFVPKYLSLLSRGYDTPPPELLARSVGIDLARPEVLVRDAGVVIGRWRAELEMLYASP